MSMYYILDKDGKTPRPTDMMTAAAWMETADRTVARTITENMIVSTVFLTINHGLYGEPLLFETMVFAREGETEVNYEDLQTQRYATYEEAKAGHLAICQKVYAIEAESKLVLLGLKPVASD